MGGHAAASAVNVTGSGVVAAGAALYKGLSLREVGETPGPAVVEVYDNPAAAAGALLATVALAAGESYSETLVDGLFATSGIWVEVVAGAVTGSIRIG